MAIFGIVIQSGKQIFSRMLDGVDPHVIDEIRHAAAHVAEVKEVTDIRARWLGPSFACGSKCDASLPNHACSRPCDCRRGEASTATSSQISFARGYSCRSGGKVGRTAPSHRDAQSRWPARPFTCAKRALMSALGQKQTCAAQKPMSAKCQKRTHAPQHVRAHARRHSEAAQQRFQPAFQCANAIDPQRSQGDDESFAAGLSGHADTINGPRTEIPREQGARPAAPLRVCGGVVRQGSKQARKGARRGAVRRCHFDTNFDADFRWGP